MTPHSASMQRRVILAALRCRTIQLQPQKTWMAISRLPRQLGALVRKNVRADIALYVQALRALSARP